MTKVSAFTLPYKRLTRTIITPIKVSKNNIEESESYISTQGIWDTGATDCAISKSLAKKLNLVPLGKVEVGTANGIAIQNYYAINLTLPNNVILNNVKANEVPKNNTNILI